jgi:diguanylate cyclase (GGDEF)-like protein
MSEPSRAIPAPGRALPIAARPAAKLIAYFFPAAFLACHAAAIKLLPDQAAALSFVFLVSAPLTAAFACLVRARRGSESDGWAAAGSAMGLWAAGMAAVAYGTQIVGESDRIDAVSTFLFVLYGVPLIFAMASTVRDHWYVGVTDGAMAFALGCMFFGHSFAFATLTGVSPQGILNLRLMYDIENVFIASFAFLRFATANDTGRRAFFGALMGFAIVYLLVAGFTNHFESEADYGGITDLVIDLPFLFFFALTIGRFRILATSATVSRRTEHMIRAAAPLMLATTLLVVSGLLLRDRPGFALVGFVVATLGTGIRNVLIQMRSSEEHDALDELARVDALTGLPNRRQFDLALKAEWNRARRNGSGLALLMIDIDHFKLLNDTFGHPVGDRRLREVGTALAACATRSSDLVARYGGEEFVALLPTVELDEVSAIAEAMRARIAALRLASPVESGIITISIGVGYAARLDSQDPGGLLATADSALYLAKRAGRNRVATEILATG